jgi:hypothetical protein
VTRDGGRTCSALAAPLRHAGSISCSDFLPHYIFTFGTFLTQVINMGGGPDYEEEGMRAALRTLCTLESVSAGSPPHRAHSLRAHSLHDLYEMYIVLHI